MLKDFIPALALATLIFVAALSRAQPAHPPQWVGTWATSPVQAEGIGIRLFSSVTMREVVHISAGGAQIRLRFTNEFGLDLLTVADAHVALSAGGSSIHPESDHPVTFGGAASVNIPPGAAIFSDPVAFKVAPLTDLAVSFYLPPQIMRAETAHGLAVQDNYVAEGHSPAATDLSQPTTLISWYFLDGVDVAADGSVASDGSNAAEPGPRAIVAFGDSITDGYHSTQNANRRWPDVLAARLNEAAKADRHLAHVAVLDEGISGNRILNDVIGPSALSRVHRDVLDQSGVRYVILLEGINDITRLGHVQTPGDAITVPQLEWAYRQIADRAHERGIKIIAGTIMPYGRKSGTPEEVREAVNDWIRSSGVFDGVVDFDKIMSDPQNPTSLNPAYDSGDHVHPNDAGYKAMGEGIDLSLFAK